MGKCCITEFLFMPNRALQQAFFLNFCLLWVLILFVLAWCVENLMGELRKLVSPITFCSFDWWESVGKFTSKRFCFHFVFRLSLQPYIAFSIVGWDLGIPYFICLFLTWNLIDLYPEILWLLISLPKILAKRTVEKKKWTIILNENRKKN